MGWNDGVAADATPAGAATTARAGTRSTAASAPNRPNFRQGTIAVLLSPPDPTRVVAGPTRHGTPFPTARVGLSALPCASYDGAGDGRRARYDVLRAVQRHRGQHRDRHPGQARGGGARARVPARRGPSAHRGRARAWARPAWPRPWRRRSTPTGSGCSSPPTCCPPTSSGVTVWNRGRDIFEFRPGPIFANIVLGDEINRASPKTQSALLEAMEERQVTVDGTTYPLASPVHGDRHPEPDRARGHLSAAREPARPLPHAAVGRLPQPPVRAGDPRHPRLGRHAVRGPSGGHRRPDPGAGRTRSRPSTWPRR